MAGTRVAGNMKKHKLGHGGRFVPRTHGYYGRGRGRNINSVEVPHAIPGNNTASPAGADLGAGNMIGGGVPVQPAAAAAGAEGALEPVVPAAFLAQKAGKAKVEEVAPSEGKETNKPFCFRCYKPGHGKLDCVAQLLCNICESTEHHTSKCSILKQPRTLAHPCGYDVPGLGFYHIPHAPVNPGRSSNNIALVTVQGGSITMEQLVAELGRLIPERWNWQVTPLDNNSFVVPFPSRGDLQRSESMD